MKRLVFCAAVAAVALNVGGIGLAFGAEAAPHGPMIQALYDCRTLADDAAQLACFKTAVDALQKAEQQRHVVIVDREAAHANQARDFGAKKTTLEKALQPTKGEKRLSYLALKLDHAQRLGDGRLVFVTEDGAVWRQKDQRDLPDEPAKGSTLEVRRSVFGVYYCTPAHLFAVECERTP
jgi:uncharacterized protein (UPF0548 family)